MESEIPFPQTLQEAIKTFSDPEVAHRFAVNLRWPEGVTCTQCGGKRHSFIKTRRTWECKACKKRFTVKTGSLMEDSPLKLETWMTAVWLITGAKNGISSCEVSRALGVTQKTAWFLLHRIREAMQNGSMEKMTGPVEVDETFIGGKEKNKHSHKKQNKGRGTVGKEIVMGVLERGGEVRVKHIPDTEKETLHAQVKKQVEPGAEVFTDALVAYRSLSPEFKHQWIDHAVKYAEGQVHTNGLENFWSLFDRMLGGTYTHIDPRHLAAYLNEESYRYNMRKGNDAKRFAKVTGSLQDKRLTYQELTGRGLKTLAPE